MIFDHREEAQKLQRNTFSLLKYVKIDEKFSPENFIEYLCDVRVGKLMKILLQIRVVWVFVFISSCQQVENCKMLLIDKFSWNPSTNVMEIFVCSRCSVSKWEGQIFWQSQTKTYNFRNFFGVNFVQFLTTFHRPTKKSIGLEIWEQKLYISSWQICFIMAFFSYFCVFS